MLFLCRRFCLLSVGRDPRPCFRVGQFTERQLRDRARLVRCSTRRFCVMLGVTSFFSFAGRWLMLDDIVAVMEPFVALFVFQASEFLFWHAIVSALALAFG